MKKTTSVKMESVESEVKISTVKILGKRYVMTPLSTSVGDNEFGQCNYLTQTISFNERLGYDELRDTLVHEVLHCIDHAICTELSEKQIHAMASGLYAVMKDNPMFMEWVLKDNDEKEN